MNASAEGDVTGGPAVDVEAFGFIPAVRMQVSNVCIIAVVVEGSLPGWCGPVADE